MSESAFPALGRLGPGLRGMGRLGAFLIGMALAVATGCSAPAPSTAVPAPGAGPGASSGSSSAAARPEASAPSPVVRKPLRVVYTVLSVNMMPLWLAKEEGIYDKYGLDAELVFIQGGSQAVQAMVAREVDVGALSGADLVNASMAGADTVLLGALYRKFGFDFMAAPDIQTPQDLRGKAIGISRFGSTADIAARFALRSWGLDPTRDVTLIQVGEASQILAAMESGAVQGGPLTSPTDLRAKELGYRSLGNMSEMPVNYPQAAIGSTKTFARDNPESLERFMRALVEAIHFFKTNKEESIRVLSQYTKTEDRAALERSYTDNAERLMERDPSLTTKDIEVILEQLAPDKPEARTANPAQFLEDGFMARLRGDGLPARLYR